MENYIQDLFKKIVGVGPEDQQVAENKKDEKTSNDETKTDEKQEKPLKVKSKEEEEEKKAPCVLDDDKKIVSFLQLYETKDVKLPEVPKITAEDLAKTINVLFDQDHLDFRTISQLFAKSVDLAKKPYIDINFKNRKDRRRMYSVDKKIYNDLVIELVKETENLMNVATEELLEALNLSKEFFENSMMALMEKGFYQQIFMAQASNFPKLKECLGSNKDLKIEDMKKVLRYQLALLTERQNEFTDLIDTLKVNPETAQMIPLAINVIITDLIYDKFEYEEEDQVNIMKDTTAIMNDQEMYTLMMTTEEIIQTMMTSSGLIGEEMGQF